jgi:hypothetical protein
VKIGDKKSRWNVPLRQEVNLSSSKNVTKDPCRSRYAVSVTVCEFL